MIHVLSVEVTPSMSLEWRLHVNNKHIGTYLDEVTNILFADRLSAALSYTRVLKVYKELLAGPPITR